MNKTIVRQELLKILPKNLVLEDEPMKNHTSFNIGGPIDFLVLPKTEEQLVRLIEFCKNGDIFVKVIGNGSNLLVCDNGVDGIFIKTTGLREIACERQNTVTAQSGAMLGRLANFCKDNSLTGMEFAHGIPGTVGGAVWMNAGAYDGEISAVLTKSRVLDGDLKVAELDNSGHEFDYRQSVFTKNQQLVILSSCFELKPGNSEQIKAKMDDFLARRAQKQPLNLPSAGSTFKRPDGDFASRLVDECGLKGYAIGGACVSEKHAGFIVNKANATFEDVVLLIDYVKEQVFKQRGIMLECEVLIVNRDGI